MTDWWKTSGALYPQLIARSWADEAFAQQLIAQPRQVLAKYGIKFPEEIEVKVVAGQNEVVFRPGSPQGTLELPLPGKPSDLDQESLQNVFRHWPFECLIFC